LALAGFVLCLGTGPADAGAPGPRARLFRVGSCGAGGPQCQWECNAPDPRQLPKCGGGTRCAVDGAEAFVAHLVVTVDDAACAPEAGGARVTLGLRGRRRNGTEFTVPDRTFDLCGVDVACAGCDLTLCPEAGVTCPRGRVYLCNGDAREGETARASESNLAALETWLGSESGAEPGQLLPPDVEADVKAAFPEATGRPLVVTAKEIESERQDHAADGSPSVRGFCIKAWFTRSAYDVDVPALPSVASPSSVTSVSCAGPCGDSKRDPGEGCDDGNTGRLDGCDERCRAVCAAPRTDCRLATRPIRSRLLVENRPHDRADSLRWTFANDPVTTTADFGDPPADDDYVLCIYDESGETAKPILAAVAAGGEACSSPPCWQGLGGRGVAYEDRAASPHGVKRLRLQAGGTDARIALKGTGGHLSLPDLPLPLPLRVQLERKDGACWDATYGQAGTSRNDARRFEAVAGP
jgi:cysteine-rich repeat protein